jgi:hypothetical protein
MSRSDLGDTIRAVANLLRCSVRARTLGLEGIREVCISVSKPVTVIKGLKGATLGGTRQPEGVPSPPMSTPIDCTKEIV